MYPSKDTESILFSGLYHRMVLEVLEECATSIFRVIDIHLQDYMLSQSRRPQYEHPSMCKLKTLNKVITSLTQN